MKLSVSTIGLLFHALLHVAAIDIDCSMSESTRCDCIYEENYPAGFLQGDDCRVCRVDGQLMCVLWGSTGVRYGPLCEPRTCPEGKTWKDGKDTPGKCHCDWQSKEHDRMPCVTPGGDCKCLFVDIKPTGAVTSVLPGETCTVCIEGPSDGGYFCTEQGNKKNKYGPLCMGDYFTPPCRGGKTCVCNWMMSMDGDGWRNSTI